MSHLSWYKPGFGRPWVEDQQNYDCALNMISDIKPKMISTLVGTPWACEINMLSQAGGGWDVLGAHRATAADVHAIDPDILMVFGWGEVICSDVKPGSVEIPIPQYVKNDLSTILDPLEMGELNGASFFDSRQMGLHNGAWNIITNPVAGESYFIDLTTPMAKAWFYWWAHEAVDAGFEAVHIGQFDKLARNKPFVVGGDPGFRETNKLFDLVRSHASTNARRNFVIIDGGQTNQYVQDPNLAPDLFLFDLTSGVLQISETQPSNNNPSIPEEVGSSEVAGHLVTGDGLGNNHDILEATIKDCDPVSGLYNASLAGTNHLGWHTNSNPYFVEFDNATYAYWFAPIYPPHHGQECHFPWLYDESIWFHFQPEKYRRHWLIYAWHRVRCLDVNGSAYMAMPGIRPVGYDDMGGTVTPYYSEMRAWSQSCNPITDPNDPDEVRRKRAYGFADVIKHIWDANDNQLPSSFNGKDLRPYNKWANMFFHSMTLNDNPGAGLNDMPAGRKFFGDFNGDGLLDILETAHPTNPTAWAGWKIYLMNSNAPNGGVPYNVNNPDYSGSWPSSWEKYYIGDFDGDGKDDFMVTADCSLPFWNPGPWQGYKIYTAANNFGQYATGSFPNCGERINIGDFNGDGKDDYLVSADNTLGVSWQGYKIFEVTPGTPNDNTEIYSAIWPSWGERFHIGDYDGNGMDDIMVTTDIDVNNWNVIDGYYVYKTVPDPNNNNNIAIYNHAYANWPSWGENFAIADYNEDGRSDILVTASNKNNVDWLGSKVYLANEAGDHFIYAFDQPDVGLQGNHSPSIYANTQFIPYKNHYLLWYVDMVSASSLSLHDPLHCNTQTWNSAKPGKGYVKSGESIVTMDNIPDVLSVNQVNASHGEFSVYPNPSKNGLFTIEGGISNMADEGGEITVLDIQGRLLLKTDYSGKNSLDLSSYANGTYILKVKLGNTVEQRRLIISK